jgi:hypothetical protein
LDFQVKIYKRGVSYDQITRAEVKISACFSPATAGEALYVEERQVVQLIIMLILADFYYYLWKAENRTLAIFPLHLELLQPPLETKRATCSTNEKQEKLKTIF